MILNRFRQRVTQVWPNHKKTKINKTEFGTNYAQYTFLGVFCKKLFHNFVLPMLNNS